MQRRCIVPCTKLARKPTTSPEQWNIGNGQQITSDGVNPICHPICLALFSTFLWVRLTALGAAVVPEVNCRLRIVSQDICSGRLNEFLAVSQGLKRSEKSFTVDAPCTESSRKSPILKTCCSDGIDVAASMSFSKWALLERGSRYGGSMTVPKMMDLADTC